MNDFKLFSFFQCSKSSGTEQRASGFKIFYYLIHTARDLFLRQGSLHRTQDDAVSGLFLSAEGIAAGFPTAARVGAPYADVGTAAAISLMVGAGGDAAL